MLFYLFVSFSYLYQIAHLGDDDEEPEFSSAMPLEEGDTFFFQPRPLKNLVLVDEQENLSPIMSCQVSVCVCLHAFVPIQLALPKTWELYRGKKKSLNSEFPCWLIACFSPCI